MPLPLAREQALLARGLRDYQTRPTLKSQTRHSRPGQTCHHWIERRVTCDEYDDLRARAAGHCGICGVPEAEAGGKRLVVDHYGGYRLNIIRGMLCDYCNTTVMACMDGVKNWSEKSWCFRNEALAYLASSWDRPSEEQWARIASEVEGRLRSREYSPRVSADRRAKYVASWSAEVAKLCIDTDLRINSD